jgi:protein gp37
MAQPSTIEWTDATWNPVRGCTKISPGCKHCYAETFAERWRGIPGHPYERGFDLRLVPEHLVDPLRWATGRMIFVNSMSDLFHDAVPLDFIRMVFEVMALANWHTYQVLTKRAERMREIVARLPPALQKQPHVWLGVSVENREQASLRIRHLQRTNAAIRFLSIEPLLEDIGKPDLDGIDWVIVGGESGFRARAMEKVWVRSIRDRCKKENIAFFFKQWGGVRKGRAGRVLDGRMYNDLPSRTTAPPPSLVERQRRIALVEELVARYTGVGGEAPRGQPRRRNELLKVVSVPPAA